jgi:hypothetical protein
MLFISVRHICVTFDAPKSIQGDTKYSPWIHQNTKSPVCYQNYFHFVPLRCKTGLHFPLNTKFVFQSTCSYFWIIILLIQNKVICYLLCRQSFKSSHKEFVILRCSTNQLFHKSWIKDCSSYLMMLTAETTVRFVIKKCRFKFLQ